MLAVHTHQHTNPKVASFRSVYTPALTLQSTLYQYSFILLGLALNLLFCPFQLCKATSIRLKKVDITLASVTSISALDLGQIARVDGNGGDSKSCFGCAF